MHLRRRPGPSSGRGVVTSGLACGLAGALLSACSTGGPIEIDDPDVSPADRATCEALVADLPDTLAGQDRVDVEPTEALGAAWGDPAYVLSCGVPLPSDYEETAECNIIKGVGWYVPNDQLTHQGEDATPVALSLAPYVEVDVPSDYRAEGIDRALADLAPVLKQHLGEGLSCL